MCQHTPRCPDARAPDRTRAKILACHPGPGWSLLCHGVVLFDDAGELVLSRLPAAASPTPARKPACGRRAAV